MGKTFRGKAPPNSLLPVLEHIKQAYLLWHTYHSILPKTHRYSIGNKIDKLWVELIEAISAAAFLPKHEKLPYLRLGIRKLDTLKLFLLILWESKSLETKQFIRISEQLETIGKMLGGWYGQVEKQNSATK
jgi:hypothetical protein